MILTSLCLQNFRNYRQHSFKFSPNTTVIIGPNACGKTNVLEAIYLLATGRSFKATLDREMIFYGEELTRLTGKVIRHPSAEGTSQEIIDLEVILTRGQVQGQKTPYKKLLLNGVSKRLIDFAGTLRVVVFWPQDLELITRSPSSRRSYLNSVLSQTERKYRRHLIAYEKALRNRNKLLEKIREGLAQRSQLSFWDKLVIKNGQYLTKKREEFLEFVNQTKIDKEEFFVVYEANVISPKRLEKYAQQEVAAAATLVGPHRDDFKIQIQNSKFEIQNHQGRDIHIFGSRGEQRLAVLWLKLAELAFIEKETGSRPILLLDDIFSELDYQHRQLVVELIGKQQTIITTTDEQIVKSMAGELEKVFLFS